MFSSFFRPAAHGRTWNAGLVIVNRAGRQEFSTEDLLVADLRGSMNQGHMDFEPSLSSYSGAQSTMIFERSQVAKLQHTSSL